MEPYQGNRPRANEEQGGNECAAGMIIMTGRSSLMRRAVLRRQRAIAQGISAGQTFERPDQTCAGHRYASASAATKGVETKELELHFDGGEAKGRRPRLFLAGGRMKACCRLNRVADVVGPFVLLGRRIKVVEQRGEELKSVDGGEILRIRSDSLERKNDQQEL
jgi:hypothetical protein